MKFRKSLLIILVLPLFINAHAMTVTYEDTIKATSHNDMRNNEMLIYFISAKQPKLHNEPNTKFTIEKYFELAQDNSNYIAGLIGESAVKFLPILGPLATLVDISDFEWRIKHKIQEELSIFL